MPDLEESIQLLYKAIKTTSQGDPMRLALLINLTLALQTKYTRTQVVADINVAIQIARDFFEEMPEGHPDSRRCLSVLGGCLSSRSEITEGLNGITEAVDLLQVSRLS
jgi:hypothetical protein